MYAAILHLSCNQLSRFDMKALLVLACVLVASCQAQGYWMPHKCFGKNNNFKEIIDKILDAIDVNNDGIITLQEDIDDLLSMDRNKDGGTSRDEYVDFLYDNYCLSKVSGSLIFDLVDGNKDSQLTAADVDRANFDANGNVAKTDFKQAFLGLDGALQGLTRQCQVAGSYRKPSFFRHKYFG